MKGRNMTNNAEKVTLQEYLDKLQIKDVPDMTQDEMNGIIQFFYEYHLENRVTLEAFLSQIK